MKSRVKLGDGARYKPGEDSYVVNVGGRNVGRRKSDIMDEINTLKQVRTVPTYVGIRYLMSRMNRAWPLARPVVVAAIQAPLPHPSLHNFPVN